jgi:hypothetical protein
VNLSSYKGDEIMLLYTRGDTEFSAVNFDFVISNNAGLIEAVHKEQKVRHVFPFAKIDCITFVPKEGAKNAKPDSN